MQELFEDAAKRFSRDDITIYPDDITLLFAAHQVFGDTSMGRGGLAGQTITRGITYVVLCMMTGEGFVYRVLEPDYKFCYRNSKFREWMSSDKSTMPPNRMHSGGWVGHKNCDHIVEMENE